MDFVGGLARKRKGHDYLFVGVDRFRKMYILMHCKNTIKGQYVASMLFGKFWVPLSDTKEHHLIQELLYFLVSFGIKMGEQRH